MYDDIDMAYEQAVIAYQGEAYFKALTTLFNASLSRSECTDYYKHQWFPIIENGLAMFPILRL